jgi:hypothetical protein
MRSPIERVGSCSAGILPADFRSNFGIAKSRQDAGATNYLSVADLENLSTNLRLLFLPTAITFRIQIVSRPAGIHKS